MSSANELDFDPEFNPDFDAQDLTSLPALLPVQEQVLELITHLADYSDVLVLVTGPDGSGKTLLARTLASRRHGNDDVLLLTANVMLGMPALLQHIAAHWQLSLPTDPAAARDQIRREAGVRADQGGSLLLLIDQASELDSDTLNDIAHLALLAPQALNIVLFGLPGLEQMLRGGPAQAAVQVQALAPLNLTDAQQLLQAVYSPSAPLPLDQKTLAFIHQQSAGWPGPLLLQAGDHLLAEDVVQTEAAPARRRKGPALTTGRFPLLHIVAIAALIAALGISWLYRGQEADTIETLLPEPQPVDFLRGIPLPGEDVGYVGDVGDVGDEPMAASPDSPPETPLPDFNFAPPVPVAPAVPAVPAAPAVASAAKPAPVAASPVRPVAAPPAALAAPASRPADDRQRLLAVQSGFVVQLFGTHEAANADKFRRQWRDEIIGTLYLYETRHNNKPWFVVVAGVYGSRAEATAAVNALPRPLRDQSPWIRDISAVKQALR